MKLIISEKEKLKEGTRYLHWDDSVEYEFMRILERNKKAFWDEDSLQLMKEIDGAVRCESYGVITPIDESCISCLSTGCKFGLIVLHYLKEENPTKLVVKSWIAGENVWKWLDEHTDAILYVLEEDLDYIFTMRENLEICYEDKWYNTSDRQRMWEVEKKCKQKLYTLTKETENAAYEQYERRIEKRIFCDIKEEISLDKFVERFPEDTYCTSDERWNEVTDYKVINYCKDFPIEFLHRKHPLYVCGKKGEEVEICHKLTVKYPKFLEVLWDDVLLGTEYIQDENKGRYLDYADKYEEWFILLLNGEEVCKIEEYPDNTILGFEVKPKEKCITILDQHNAIKRFHKICEKHLK